jgi:hypothetical protein
MNNINSIYPHESVGYSVEPTLGATQGYIAYRKGRRILSTLKIKDSIFHTIEDKLSLAEAQKIVEFVQQPCLHTLSEAIPMSSRELKEMTNAFKINTNQL